jgi:hypothetical protein
MCPEQRIASGLWTCRIAIRGFAEWPNALGPSRNLPGIQLEQTRIKLNSVSVPPSIVASAGYQAPACELEVRQGERSIFLGLCQTFLGRRHSAALREYEKHNGLAVRDLYKLKQSAQREGAFRPYSSARANLAGRSPTSSLFGG